MMDTSDQCGELSLRGKPFGEMSVFFKIGADIFFGVGINGAEDSRKNLIGQLISGMQSYPGTARAITWQGKQT